VKRDNTAHAYTWRTFLANHIGQIVAADFFVVPTATGRLLFVLVLLAHHVICCAIRGQPQLGFRCFMSTTAAMIS
jgi:hypothetical protein